MDDDNERDEAIVSAKIEGASTRALARQYGCTSREIEQIVDAKLDYELDNRQRLRLVKLSTERILSLMVPFYEKAVKDKDVSAGTLCCKLEERLSMLLGTDAPTQQRLDVYAVEAQQKPSQHERIRDAINGFWDRLPPAQKELRERLHNIDAEEALRLLDAAGVKGKDKGKPTDGNGNGAGKVDGNGGSDPTEPPR